MIINITIIKTTLETNAFYLKAFKDKTNIGPSSPIIIKVQCDFYIQTTELIAIGEKYFQINAKGKSLEIIKKYSKSSPNEE